MRNWREEKAMRTRWKTWTTVNNYTIKWNDVLRLPWLHIMDGMKFLRWFWPRRAWKNLEPLSLCLRKLYFIFWLKNYFSANFIVDNLDRRILSWANKSWLSMSCHNTDWWCSNSDSSRNTRSDIWLKWRRLSSFKCPFRSLSLRHKMYIGVPYTGENQWEETTSKNWSCEAHMLWNLKFHLPCTNGSRRTSAREWSVKAPEFPKWTWVRRYK
jgi:hypothetical protein